MIKITDELLKDVSNRAKASERKRANHNLHKSSEDSVQRFLNAIEPDTYVRPHKHENPGKTEILIILRGRALILELDENGRIHDHIILDPSSGNRGVEIPPDTWHSFMSLQKGTVLYEIKAGPFVKETDKVFAEWSPEEGTQEAHEFNKKIIRQLDATWS